MNSYKEGKPLSKDLLQKNWYLLQKNYLSLKKRRQKRSYYC